MQRKPSHLRPFPGSQQSVPPRFTRGGFSSTETVINSVTAGAIVTETAAIATSATLLYASSMTGRNPFVLAIKLEF
jgi:hypothetical protein